MYHIGESHLKRWACNPQASAHQQRVIRERCAGDCETVRAHAYATATLSESARPTVVYNPTSATNIIALIGPATLGGMRLPEVVLDEIAFEKAFPFGETMPSPGRSHVWVRRRFQLATPTPDQFAIAGPALWEVLLLLTEGRISSRASFQSAIPKTIACTRTIQRNGLRTRYRVHTELIHFLHARVRMSSPFATLIVANDYHASRAKRRKWLSTIIAHHHLTYLKRIPQWMPTRTYIRDNIVSGSKTQELSLPFTVQPRTFASDSSSLVYGDLHETPALW